MLKKTVTYIDFDGNERTEDFFFNLTEQEIAEMELSTEGGLGNFINKAVAAKSQVELIELFKKLILAAYGVKSADGRRFVKNDAVREDFMSTQAFSDIYMELVQDADKASAFFNGIVPKEKNKAPVALPARS